MANLKCYAVLYALEGSILKSPNESRWHIFIAKQPKINMCAKANNLDNMLSPFIFFFKYIYAGTNSHINAVLPYESLCFDFCTLFEQILMTI